MSTVRSANIHPLHWMTLVFVSGVGVSKIGDFIYMVAINVFVLHETHSPTAVAGLWVVAKVASLLVGPWAGSISDRFSARNQLILFEVCRAVLIGIMPFLSKLALIYLVLFLLGVFTTFFNNVFLPYQTMLIPAEHRKRVNSITSTLSYSAFLIGPAIAGALMLNGSVAVPLWLDSVSFLMSGLSFVLLPNLLREVAAPSTQNTGSVSPKGNPWMALRQDWQEAVTFLRSHALFTALLCLNAVTMLMANTADTQEVVFATDALGLGQVGYGMMVTAAGVGFTGGSILLSLFSHRIKTHWLIAAGIALNALGYLVYACSHSFWWAVAGLIVLGLFGSAGNVGYATFQQHTVPVSIMGRVNNVVNPPQDILNIVFILVGGVAAAHFGVRSLMMTMTILMSICALAVAVLVLAPRNRARMAAVDATAGASA